MTLTKMVGGGEHVSDSKNVDYLLELEFITENGTRIFLTHSVVLSSGALR